MARNPLKPGLMIAICCGLATCQVSALQENPGAVAATTDLDRRVQAYLDDQRDRWSGGFSDADGRLLYKLILQSQSTRVVEIGTGTGHSAIWLAWALSKTGGRLTTIEINPSRCREATNCASSVAARRGSAIRSMVAFSPSCHRQMDQGKG